jgi:hypothetical protein
MPFLVAITLNEVKPVFALHTNEHRRVVAAQRGAEHIPAGAGVPGFRDVQTWAATLNPPLDLNGEFPPGAVVFFDRDTLADYCRRYGTMLYTTAVGFMRGEDRNCGNRDWVSLMRAVAIRPEDEGPQNPAGIRSDCTLLWVPTTLFETLSDVFAHGNEQDPLWCVSSHPVKRAFVYLDVSGFSKYPPGQEALVVNSLVWLTSDLGFWSYEPAAEALRDLEAQLCIGDGYIYVFRIPLMATFFAAYSCGVSLSHGGPLWAGVSIL